MKTYFPKATMPDTLPSAEPLSYYQVTHQIDQTQDFSILPETELNGWEKTIQEYIKGISPHNHEDIAIGNFYLLSFLLKTRRITDEKKIEQYYIVIKKHFLEEEREYHKKLKATKNKKEKKLLSHQMVSFYKLAEFYLSYLEKTFASLSLNKLKTNIDRDKVHFLQMQQLAEGNVSKFLVYARLSISMFLKRHDFLYALLGVIGIVLVWQGIWGLLDWIIEQLNTDHFTPYIVTTSLGIIILYFLGIFFKQTIGGDKGELEKLADLEMREMSEIKTLESAVMRRLKKK